MKFLLTISALLALSSAKLKEKTFHAQPYAWESTKDIERWYNVLSFSQSPSTDTSRCNKNACVAGNKSVRALDIKIIGDDDKSVYKVCVCDQPNMEVAAVGLRLSLVPKFMRDYVEVVTIASKDYKGPVGTIEGTPTIVASEPMRGSAFVRAAAKIFDATGGNMVLSKSPDWVQAVTKDSCVFDPTSNTDLKEAFSYIPLVWMRTHATKEKIDCMRNQLEQFGKWVSADATKLLKVKQNFEPELDAKKSFLPDRVRWVGVEEIDKYFVSTPFKTSATNDLKDCEVQNCKGGNKKATAFNVDYNDGTKHKFCVCDQPVVSLEKAAQKWGFVPKYMRVHTDILTIASNAQGAAYATGKKISMLADLPTGAYIHEAAHNFDAHARKGGNLSKGAEFTQAVKADSCVGTSYARSSIVEDFAEVAVIQMLKPYLKMDSACLKNQLDAFAKFIPKDAVKTKVKENISI